MVHGGSQLVLVCVIVHFENQVRQRGTLRKKKNVISPLPPHKAACRRGGSRGSRAGGGAGAGEGAGAGAWRAWFPGVTKFCSLHSQL